MKGRGTPYKEDISISTLDSWGNPTELNGTQAGTVGRLNPFRYRGYVWDEETGLYYLNSRYYDPEVGRFINADGQISGVGGEILGYNMFTYCFNNPVNMDDFNGNWPKLSTILKGVAIVAVAVAVVATCVATAPVIAGIGVASGTAAVAASIATAAMYVAGVAATAAVVARTVELTKTIPKKNQRNQSVYIMRDKATNTVKYVGRTINPVRRQSQHNKDPKKANLQPLEVKFTGLTKLEARAVEQLLISAYTLDNLTNARREIAVGNVNGFKEHMNNVINIFGGAIESDFLNLMGR